MANLENAALSAQQVLEIESLIAACHWDQVKDRDAELTYNKKSFAQLTQLAPDFDWQLWISSSKTPMRVLEQVVIRQPSYFEGLSKLLAAFDLPKWRSWLTWHVLSGASPYLSSQFVNENFAFYGTTLSGIPKLKDRWKRGVGLVEGALGEAVGQIYVERHFGESAKTKMVELVKNLITAYRVSI